jgi:prepilin signal peptidase PulO-like enzyme (type II secretory pathway)
MASLGESGEVRSRAGMPARSSWPIADVARRAAPYAAFGGVAASASIGFLRFGLSAEAVVAAFVLAVLLWLSAIDIARRIVPNVIVLPAAALVLLAHLGFEPGRWREWVLAAVGTAAFLFLWRWISRGSLGMGDVKLGLLLGAALGSDVVAGLLIGTCAAAAFGLVLVARGGRDTLAATIPYVPFLAFGAVVVLLVGGSSARGLL